uniref:Uncharacterized protein n=1 Tax=Amphimedon queenslandica TaxID=400682 RepID=A0A1X7TU72_AMPQE
MAVSIRNQELKVAFFHKVDSEAERYALTSRERKEVEKIKMNNIRKDEDVDVWRNIDSVKLDEIIRGLKSFGFDDAFIQSLRNTLGSGARTKVHRTYSWNCGKVNIVYGVFAAAQVSRGRYDLVIAYYKISFDARRVDGKSITEGLLENQQRLQALKYFRAEAK